MGENVFALLQKKIPQKQKDPSMFTIPCTIRNKFILSCILDLGASINVILYSLYTSLSPAPLTPTRVVIQLADRSKAYLKGVVEDVLVQVNELVLPTDFYVLKMEGSSNSSNSSPILLGRPFLKTVRTQINVHNNTLSMEFDGEKIHFNLFYVMKHPCDELSNVSMIDIIGPLVAQMFELTYIEMMQSIYALSIDKNVLNSYPMG
jgi:hypothetical protein